MGRQLTIALTVVVLVLIIAFSAVLVKVLKPAEVTGSAVEEMSAPREFSVKNTVFIVLLAVTIVAVLLTARKVAVYKHELNTCEPEEGYGPEIEEAKNRAGVKNQLNNFINLAVEKELTEDEIVEALVSKGWPEEYTRNYVKYFLETI